MEGPRVSDLPTHGRARRLPKSGIKYTIQVQEPFQALEENSLGPNLSLLGAKGTRCSRATRAIQDQGWAENIHEARL